MDLLIKIWDKYTKCDSGKTLNPLMHLFLFITAVGAVAFVFLPHTEAVQSSVLFQETDQVGTYAVSAWGLVAAAVTVMHTVAFWVRGLVGAHLMRLVVFGGAYLWMWASVVYLQEGYWFQFLWACVPNLGFWLWYALQWRKRKRGDFIAFV